MFDNHGLHICYEILQVLNFAKYRTLNIRAPVDFVNMVVTNVMMTSNLASLDILLPIAF